ncbi:General secretion pathway protein B [Alteromonas sp. 38]|uniref:general secretion pathway protein GspB n=1 Tax=Alteromonas TaxID=226 RepID=UPI0012F07527|nr:MULTISPECIES: general secretion pathway protein GspB [Alteromonas]CAD5287215.1 General secretion pathway protein B [Alteromonas sp. 154]VXB30996.1 General secretion pathway protein B [Alteromonas sp. 38]
MSNILSISDLKPGMVIVRITQQNGPVKIRKSGLVSSDAMVEGLAEMGVQEIEIDPDQTVEIAPATTAGSGHRTQTQALLRGQHDTSAKFDKTLSDQFNRSLFLPTVQGLPSMWKVYGKELATYSTIVAGGFCLGFLVATRGEWWPAVTASVVETIQPETSTTAATSELGSEALKQAPTQELAQTSSQLTAQVSGQGSVQGAEQTAAPIDTPLMVPNASEQVSTTSGNPPSEGIASQEVGSDDISQASRANNSPNSQSLPSQNSTGNQALTENRSDADDTFDLAVAEEEGRVLNSQGNQDDNKIEVSPELLARFNQAVAALDTQAENNDFEPETKVTVRDNIQRVDQLPVRLLTRLPSMNFSAHMYASRPDDRWVRVNGKQMSEGDWIDDKVQIVNIEAQQVVLGFEEELFTMAALTDW